MALNVTNLEGNEIADDYTRQYVPKGRWSDTWGVFKSNFLKLVLINVFVLITFVPGIAIILFRNWYIAGMGYLYPFNSSILYPFYPEVAGLTEKLTLSADLLFYALLIPASFIASVGLSGAAYSIRKLLNTHGQFTVKGFFHGVKVGYLNTVLPAALVAMFMFATLTIGDWMRLVSATGGNSAGAVTAYVFIIIATVLVCIYSAWLFAVGTSYRVSLGRLFKNSFVLMIGTPVQTIFMAGFSLIPVWLVMIGGFLQVIGYIVFILFGFSMILISWVGYTQWVFDAYVNPKVKPSKEESKKGAKETSADREEDDKRHARELLAAGKSELIARPIMPVAESGTITSLGKTFTRGDIKVVNEGRQKLYSDVSAYEEKHKNDAVFVEYNKLFAEREKALQSETDKKGKKKNKISSDNLLK